MFIALDLDGTLAAWEEWVNYDVIGAPIPGALNFVKALHQLGHTLVIFSARATHPKGAPAIEAWIDTHGFRPYIAEVTYEKRPEFELFVDDRAVHFAGDYRETLKEVLRRTSTE